MDTLKLSELVGQEIVELRFHYVPRNEYDLQSFHSYIKLSSDTIIDIPHFGDDEYLQLTQDNITYLKESFDTGDSVTENAKSYFVGQKIVDFYFSYYNGEVDLYYSAFIKLSNGFYLTERNFGPIGVTNIDLKILDERQFHEEVKRLNGIEVDVRSFVKTKNAC
ncbi:hypothetical protein [Flavihumibacter petaseus]|uniref:Uncharacterized protein n=1 Tax=Flavihumibacter petaseus NBRC 106054 TaxID=1220578 RepID=A0A0E9N4L2_9BACT|nr:hypothetical protein [Flavihumibacter petaseus]GAO44738.1 hypothetical protein FPE01S_03_07770 [Flavihumibacter petaseus NBRC 106054]